jgi:hypothetical protein
MASSALADTYPDCAKFDDPLAYNRCLASHGPVAGHARAIAPPGEGDEGMRAAQSSSPFHRARNGRMSMTITVEPAKPLRSPEK